MLCLSLHLSHMLFPDSGDCADAAAAAAAAGSYAALSGGFSIWGWRAMTGDNVFQLSRRDGKSGKPRPIC